jgi:hypothetical protein
MDKRKKYMLVIDTETCNGLEQPMPYDIGYAICDKKGNIYLERSFVVAEIFIDLQPAMKTAYYSQKIPQYWTDLKAGTRELKPIRKIRKQVREDMEMFNVKEVWAYNCGFDRKSLNNGIRYCSKSFFRWFFPYGTEYNCIWYLACQTIFCQKTFFKKAYENNWFTEKGNVLTNAEIAYNYITMQSDFQEQHTGLEDVKIEVAILAHCLRQHKKAEKGINSCCWRIPNKKLKELHCQAFIDKCNRIREELIS